MNKLLHIYFPVMACTNYGSFTTPYNRNSGKYCGKRLIQGGRIRLRDQLYMVAVASIKYNAVLSNFYKRLRLFGKPAKVVFLLS